MCIRDRVCTKNYCGGFSYIEYPVICKSSKLVIIDNPVYLPPIIHLNCRYASLSSRMQEFSKRYIGDYRTIDFPKLDNLWHDSHPIGDEYIKKMTWSTYQNMVEKIHIKICRYRFDAEFYSKTYLSDLSVNINLNVNRNLVATSIVDSRGQDDKSVHDTDALWRMFLRSGGMRDGIVPFAIRVPDNFDSRAYRDSLPPDRKIEDIQKLYWHWKKYSGDISFLKNDTIGRRMAIDISGEGRPNLLSLIHI